LSCPLSVTVSSGMDALTHALESYVAKGKTPVSKVFSGQAFSLVFNNLIALSEDLDNIELRARLLLGSYLAGIGLQNSGAGPAAALSYVIGSHYNVPHGIAGGIFLSPVVKLNVAKGCLDYSGLYNLIEGFDRSISEVEKNRRFSEALENLSRKLSVPASVKGYGVSPDDIDFLVEESFWLKGAIEQSPVAFTETECKSIWESLLND
jgi:alcohol dehydrogenase class IV